MLACGCAQKPEVDLGSFPQALSASYCETGSLTGLSLTDEASEAGLQAPGSACLCLYSAPACLAVCLFIRLHGFLVQNRVLVIVRQALTIFAISPCLGVDF